MSGVVLGRVLWHAVYSKTGTYTVVRDGIKPGWYTFTAEATGVYIKMWKCDGTWSDYTSRGLYLERGAVRSFYLADGQFSYYLPAGGRLRLEHVKPISPYTSR